MGDTYNTAANPDNSFANPADWTVSWAGLPIGGSRNVAAKPWANPTVNSLYVDAQCNTTESEWGYRATYTSDFTCRCLNLGY